MKTLVIFGMAALAAVTLTSANAGDHKAWDASAELKMMDGNHDGLISATEHATGARGMFEKMDTNRDGNVTAAEMDAAQQAMKGEHAAHQPMSSADKIKVVDRNSDGVLSAEEHVAGSKGMFAKMDTDGDGNLTAAELQAGHEKMLGAKPKDKTQL